MTVHIDWSQAEIVCGQLLAALRNKQYPYGEDWALPQTFIPKEIRQDPLLWARFLFYICHYMRGTIKSDHAVRQLVRVWEEHPEYFDPFSVVNSVSQQELQDVLGAKIPYKKEEIAHFWYENSCRLVQFWQGDPRTIFDEVTSAADMYERITNKRIRGKKPETADHFGWGFLGFQEKMASMLAYYLMEANLVAEFTASPPVDFHLCRILVASRVLVDDEDRTGKLRYEQVAPKGIEVLEGYCRKHNVSLVELGNALWMLSVVMCGRSPGNTSSAVQRDENNKKIYPEPNEVNWNNSAHQKAYLLTCAICPLELECQFNVFPGAYYQTGEIRTRIRERMPLLKETPLFEKAHLQVRTDGRRKTASKAKTTETEQFHLGDWPELRPRE
ncbi:MAG: hypothetical protein JWN64_490 [Parcubacteria group bacterium]|nr:hypothetical protein [Parcubacteria group bacterium]